MQTLPDEDRGGAAASASAGPERVLLPTGEVTWRRTDWSEPVGWASGITLSPKTSVVQGCTFEWTACSVARLRLGHRAGLLVLQKTPLGKLLIPNHTLDEVGPLAHVLLQTRSFVYWAPQPTVHGLVFARLGELPDVPTPEILSALAAEVASV